MWLQMQLHNLSEFFIQTHFLLRKIHYRQGAILANGVSFRQGEPNGGGCFWWWNGRAFLLMALALVLVCAATLGTLKSQQYVSKDTLWLPDNAPILADKHHYERMFGSMDVARIILTANHGYDKNLMRGQMFISLWRLHNSITNDLSVTVNGKVYTFQDVCVVVTFMGVSGCYQYNPLAFWPSTVYAPGSFKQPSGNVGAMINDPASLMFNPWTKVEDIFGGIARVNDRIVSIGAFQIHYFFDSSPERYAANPDWAQVLQQFEDALLETLKRYTFADIAPNINLSYNKEIYSTMIADWPYLGASVCIILTILALAFLSMDVIHHSRIFLGITAALTIAFSVTSTQGAASSLFLSETVFDTYAIFLVAIIGLNHLFILIHTYDRVIDKELMKPDPQLQQKGAVNDGSQTLDSSTQATFQYYVTETLAEAMPSITAVYLIGIPIYGIGILSEYCFDYQPIPGLISMSATCAFGLLILYLILNLFFIPALVLDALRVAENRTDVVCLKRETQKATVRYTPVIGDIEVAPELALPPPPPYERLCHLFFRKAIAPVVTKLPIKISVISVIILIVGLSVFVIANNQFALLPHPRQENLPSDNYLAAFYGVQDKFFHDVGIPASLVMTHADYTNEKTYKTIDEFLQKMRDSGYVREESVGNWYGDYVNYLTTKGLNISNFYLPLDSSNNTNIAVWLDTRNEGGRYAKNLIFDRNGIVESAEFTFNLIPLPEKDKQKLLDYAHHLRSMVQSDESIQRISDNRAMIYSEDFIYIDEPWILSLAMRAKIVVYLVLFLLLGLLFLDLRSVVLIVLGIACVASLVYGILMYYLNMNISVYSISCLMMLAMVSFDYHFQIAYYWMRDKGPRTTRLMNVVTEIGTSLCCSYFTQFFGMVALMFSLSSPINRAFSYLYVSITSFSFVLSVLVLPIVLSWVGLRRQRIVINRKHKRVLGGTIWDRHNLDEDGDNYWTSDDESTVYHDSDTREHSWSAGGPNENDTDSELDSDGHEQDEYGRRSIYDGISGSPATLPRKASGNKTGTPVPGDPTATGGIAPSLAGGGYEVTLPQMMTMAEQAAANGSPLQPSAARGFGSPARGSPVQPHMERRRSADVGDGSRGESGGSVRLMPHKRTASGLRELFFGSSSTSSSINSMVPTEGLDSFPSPSPTLVNATMSGRPWSREGSWLGSSSSRGKYKE